MTQPPEEVPGGAADDLARFAELGARLVDGVDEHFGPWVAQMVRNRWEQWAGGSGAPRPDVAADDAGREALRLAVTELRVLLGLDVDEQRSVPLEVLRRSMSPATAALRSAGVPPVVRDEVAERLAPDDVYDLGPASFADLDDGLAVLARDWGAAKAYLVLSRRRGGRPS